MRTLPLLALLAGCPAGTSFPTDTPNNPAAGCEVVGTEYVRASSGNLTTNQFVVDSQGLYIDLNNITTCIRSDGAGAAWLFQLNGQPYGLLRVESDAPAALAPSATNLVLDLYGATPPVRFDGSGYNGALNVLSVQPSFQVNLLGSFAGSNRSATVDIFASAAP